MVLLFYFSEKSQWLLEGRGEKEALMCGWFVRDGQGIKRPEMGRVLEGLGMMSEREGPGSEEGLRSVCR